MICKKRAKEIALFDDMHANKLRDDIPYSVMDKKMTAILYQNYSHFLVRVFITDLNKHMKSKP